MKPLEERHHRAAAALATGTAADAAAAVGVSVRTIQDWKKREDFAALVQELKDRDALHIEPSAVATLREAQGATRADGVTPDWPTRVKAAIALLNAGKPGRDPVDDDDEDVTAGLLILDPSILDDDPPGQQIDLRAFYDAWNGEISQREADAWERGDAAFTGEYR